MGSKEDAKELMNHPFFEGIDWNKLLNKEYQPPFNPGVVRFHSFIIDLFSKKKKSHFETFF